MNQVQARFAVYPNPVKSIAFVDLENNSPTRFTIRVKDVLSRVVKEQAVEYTGQNQIDMTDLSDGLYIIELTESGKRVGSTRLIKN